MQELCELTPFSVFCALYLGITEYDSYAELDPRAVSRRFDLGEGELQAYLEAHGIAEEHLQRAGLDVDSARFDIKVAPDGISRVELARTLFEEFQSNQDG
jgi:hypothetical protein